MSNSLKERELRKSIARRRTKGREGLNQRKNQAIDSDGTKDGRCGYQFCGRLKSRQHEYQHEEEAWVGSEVRTLPLTRGKGVMKHETEPRAAIDYSRAKDMRDEGLPSDRSHTDSALSISLYFAGESR